MSQKINKPNTLTDTKSVWKVRYSLKAPFWCFGSENKPTPKYFTKWLEQNMVDCEYETKYTLNGKEYKQANIVANWYDKGIEIYTTIEGVKYVELSNSKHKFYFTLVSYGTPQNDGSFKCATMIDNYTSFIIPFISQNPKWEIINQISPYTGETDRSWYYLMDETFNSLPRTYRTVKTYLPCGNIQWDRTDPSSTWLLTTDPYKGKKLNDYEYKFKVNDREIEFRAKYSNKYLVILDGEIGGGPNNLFIMPLINADCYLYKPSYDAKWNPINNYKLYDTIMLKYQTKIAGIFDGPTIFDLTSYMTKFKTTVDMPDKTKKTVEVYGIRVNFNDFNTKECYFETGWIDTKRLNFSGSWKLNTYKTLKNGSFLTNFSFKNSSQVYINGHQDSLNFLSVFDSSTNKYKKLSANWSFLNKFVLSEKQDDSLCVPGIRNFEFSGELPVMIDQYWSYVLSTRNSAETSIKIAEKQRNIDKSTAILNGIFGSVNALGKIISGGAKIAGSIVTFGATELAGAGAVAGVGDITSGIGQMGSSISNAVQGAKQADQNLDAAKKSIRAKYEDKANVLGNEFQVGYLKDCLSYRDLSEDQRLPEVTIKTTNGYSSLATCMCYEVSFIAPIDEDIQRDNLYMYWFGANYDNKQNLGDLCKFADTLHFTNGEAIDFINVKCDLSAIKLVNPDMFDNINTKEVMDMVNSAFASGFRLWGQDPQDAMNKI